jgi:hypothetical protein
MIKHDSLVTRFVSFPDNPESPAKLHLLPDQEVVQEEQPEAAGEGQVLRFLYVRGPSNRPIHYIREERLPDGTVILVRYTPELDEPCL